MVTSAACRGNLACLQESVRGKVLIGNIRHLENLDYKISGFNPDRDASELEHQRTHRMRTARCKYIAQQQKDHFLAGFLYIDFEEINGEQYSRHLLPGEWEADSGRFCPSRAQFALVHYNGNTSFHRE